MASSVEPPASNWKSQDVMIGSSPSLVAEIMAYSALDVTECPEKLRHSHMSSWRPDFVDHHGEKGGFGSRERNGHDAARSSERLFWTSVRNPSTAQDKASDRHCSP